MSKSSKIDHEGIVADIDQDFISVEITRQSACSSCGAKGLCSVSDSERGVIQVPNNGFTFYEVGEKVRVVLKRDMGFKAIWISYLIPLIILMILLLALSTFKIGELLVGLSIVVGLALYYLIVYFLRDKIKKEFVFTIEKFEK